jgi:hypothetical protein
MATETDGLLVDGQMTRRKQSSHHSLLWPCLKIFLFVSLVVTFMAFLVKAMEISKARHRAATHRSHPAGARTSHRSHATKPPATNRQASATGMDRLEQLAKKPKIGCEATVLIIRHCEKEGPTVEDGQGEQHCSYVGLERSHYLATLFGTRWPVPSHLYALSAIRSEHDNYRELETLEPISKKANLSISSAWDPVHLASQLFSTMSNSCGKLTVIAWKHSEMVELATALGCTTCPDEYPEDSFDQVWQLKYVYSPPVLYHDDTPPRRKLTRGNPKSKGSWVLYSTVTEQRFDPLEFSFLSGDYPDGGVETGGLWNWGSSRYVGSKLGQVENNDEM